MSAPHTPVGLYYTDAGHGEGLFDQLMESINAHLDTQFKKQRLNGADYAKVYVGALEGALQNTTQYLVAHILVEEQRDKTRKEIELIDKQMEQIDKEMEKTEQEIEVLKLQPALTSAQIDKINAEIAYLEAQKDMMDAQKEKIDKEIEFLDAKIRSEYANTIGSYADPNSLIGRQKALLSAQKLGFAGDLEAKVSKLHADYAAVWQSVQEDETSPVLSGTATGSAALGTAGAIKNVS